MSKDAEKELSLSEMKELLDQSISDITLYIAVIGAFRAFCKQKGLEQESTEFVKTFLKNIEEQTKTGGELNGK